MCDGEEVSGGSLGSGGLFRGVGRPAFFGQPAASVVECDRDFVAGGAGWSGRADQHLPKELQETVRFKNLKTIGIVVLRSTIGDDETLEVRYFISSLKMGVKQFAKAVRSHWQIENSCHWSLDVTYREDALRTRHRYLAENLAWLRRFTLSLLKQHPGKQSLVMKRRMCGWNDNFLMQVLGISTT